MNLSNNWRYELVQLYITITYYNIVTKSINYRYISILFLSKYRYFDTYRFYFPLGIDFIVLIDISIFRYQALVRDSVQAFNVQVTYMHEVTSSQIYISVLSVSLKNNDISVSNFQNKPIPNTDLRILL